jgi:hypothetical protein
MKENKSISIFRRLFFIFYKERGGFINLRGRKKKKKIKFNKIFKIF